MRTAVRAVRLPRPAVAVASSLMLTGLIGAVAIGQLVPSGDAGGVAVRGGWKPVGWSPDATTLLARAARYGLIDRSGRVTELPPAIASAAWLPTPPARLVLVEGAPGAQRLLLRDSASGADQELLASSSIGAYGITADGGGWAAATAEGLATGGTLAEAPGTGEPTSSVAVAHDGTRIVFRTTATSGEGGVLAVSDRGAGRLTLMTIVGVDEGAPLALAPQGTSLALVGRLGDEAGLVLVPLDPRGPPSLLVPDATPGSPLWSPGGTRLVVSRPSAEAPELELVVVDIAAGEARVQPVGPGGVATWMDDATVLLVDPLGNLIRADPNGSRTTLAGGADPGCAPAVATDRTIAWCGREGTLRLLPGG